MFKYGISNANTMRGYVGFLEQLAIYINDQSYLLSIEQNKIQYGDDDGIPIISDPEHPDKLTENKIKGKTVGISKKIEKLINDSEGNQTVVNFYKLANQDGWIKMQQKNTIFSQTKESKQNQNYQFWSNILEKHQQWVEFRKNKLYPIKQVEENINLKSNNEEQNLSKLQVLERSRSLFKNQNFMTEPPTLDIYDKREIFLDIVVNGCNLFVCNNKYCANNIKNKDKKLSYLEAALLLKEISKQELDQVEDCQTFQELEKVEIPQSEIAKNLRKQKQVQLEKIQNQFIQANQQSLNADSTQIYEQLEELIVNFIESCQEKLEFYETKIKAKKLQYKISEKYIEIQDQKRQNLHKSKNTLSQRKLSNCQNEREINLCLKMGRIYQNQLGDLKYAKKFYNRALTQSWDINSKLALVKSKHSLNRLHEVKVMSQIDKINIMRNKSTLKLHAKKDQRKQSMDNLIGSQNNNNSNFNSDSNNNFLQLGNQNRNKVKSYIPKSTESSMFPTLQSTQHSVILNNPRN